ncbi:MAG: diguanylate cyclase, partial [Lachnospiraceae bacterium]|nr:diguanylate cyclase [Lachnospiraceae bacterium]
MIDAFSIQISFLIYEAVFCLLAAIVYAASTDKLKLRKRIVVGLNIACSAMLVCEYSFYAYKGSKTPLDVAIMYIVNAAVYYLIIILMFFYAMLISVRLFERFDLKKDMPCRKRIIAVCVIAIVGIALVTISQFNGIYYYFDENNVYQRGPLFSLATLVPTLGTILVASMVIQFREKMSLSQLFVLISYLIFPFAGGVIQVLFYGNSLLNICIGLSVLLMFFENVVNKEKEVIKASKTEVRTGLANEHGYIEWLNSMKGKRDLMDYAVVFFDLRKFSDINRSYGIENGNRVLAAFGNIMIKYINKDEILGRQFGNQFVAIVRKHNLDAFLKVLKQIDVSFTDILTGQEAQVSLSARAGVYMIDRTDLAGEDILVFAGQALSTAKAKKTDDVVWLTQEIIDSIAEQKKLESEIRNGLINNEFRPFYQPKVNSSTGMMCGAEALSRWYHNGEVLAPGR